MKTEQLRALLTRADLSGIYHLPSSSVEALREAAGSLGFPCFEVDLGQSGDSGNLAAALEAFLTAYRGQPTRIFCTYTAMMALRKLLAARFGLAGFAQEGE